MATGNPTLIRALRDTAERLAAGARYEWGHMGRCNCGHLVQTLTDMTDVEIVRSVDGRLNEWTEHAKDYCDGTGSKVQDLFDTLRTCGLAPEDLRHLEHLSDRRVLARLGGGLDGHPRLRRNDVRDVTRYMTAMADILEEQPV